MISIKKMEEISNLEKKIGYEFKNKDIIREALTHRSFVNEAEGEVNHNERLEFLGDAVLELAVTKLLFDDYPDFPEGTLTSFRAALVRTESLAESSLEIELGKSLFMSYGEEATGGRDRQYILANATEAVIGALYLDGGFEVATKFIKTFIYKKVGNIVENRLDIDSKSKLQEISQEELKITPTYELLGEEGPDHSKTFEMGAIIGDKVFGKGKGESKQNAEQAAATEALEKWEELKKKFFPENMTN